MCKANREARYITTEYSVWINALYFEWDKFIPMLEKHFPDILDEILNHDNQRSPSANGEFTTSFRNSHISIGRTQRPSIPRFLQPSNRGQVSHHSSFYHRTTDVSYNHHHNTPIINPTCHKAHTVRCTFTISAGKPNNHYHLPDRRNLQSEPSINHHPHSNQQQQHHYPNIHLNDQDRASIEQFKPVICETSL